MSDQNRPESLEDKGLQDAGGAGSIGITTNSPGLALPKSSATPATPTTDAGASAVAAPSATADDAENVDAASPILQIPIPKYTLSELNAMTSSSKSSKAKRTKSTSKSSANDQSEPGTPAPRSAASTPIIPAMGLAYSTPGTAGSLGAARPGANKDGPSTTIPKGAGPLSLAHLLRIQELLKEQSTILAEIQSQGTSFADKSFRAIPKVPPGLLLPTANHPMLVDHLRSSLKQIQVRATQLHGWGQQPTLPATDRAKMLNQANRLDEYFTRAVSEISAIQKEMIESGSEDMFSGPRWVSFFNGEASSTIATGVSAGSGVPSSTGLGEAGLHSASPGIKGRPISSLGGASRIPGQSGLLSPTGIGAGGPSGSAGHAPPVTPVSLGSAISHMASQFSRHNAASMTLDGAGAGAGTAVTSGGATGVANGAGSGSGARVLSKRKIQELVGEIDPNERLEPEVEDILCDIADEFIESVTSFACQLAKHRKSNVLEAKDVQLHLERNWNIRIPGFSADEIRSVRKATLPASHQQRMQAINMMKNVKKFD